MNVSTKFLVRVTRCTLIFCVLAITAGPAHSQLLTFSKQDLLDYSAQSPFERFPDGRPKIPDNLLQQARELSSEEVWAVLQDKSFNNQYADGFRILHPDKPMVGRAFTVQFMPQRPDLEHIANAKAKERGLPELTNQTAIDMLQPGDVLVVDIFGKKVGGTIVGDNLFFYVKTATKAAAWSSTAAFAISTAFLKSTCRLISKTSIPLPSTTSCLPASTCPFASAA